MQLQRQASAQQMMPSPQGPLMPSPRGPGSAQHGQYDIFQGGGMFDR